MTQETGSKKVLEDLLKETKSKYKGIEEEIKDSDK